MTASFLFCLPQGWGSVHGGPFRRLEIALDCALAGGSAEDGELVSHKDRPCKMAMIHSSVVTRIYTLADSRRPASRPRRCRCRGGGEGGGGGSRCCACCSRWDHCPRNGD
jgi:hypothetical protein